MDEIKTYRDFLKKEPIVSALRNDARRAMILGLSLTHSINKSDNWIRFPYYHHVFDDEKKDFERQLKYLKNFGDFIDMDLACTMLEGSGQIKGRYFCISFDDGFKNCYTNMLDITIALNIPVIIYLPTDYIGLNSNNEVDNLKIRNFYPENPKPISFLSWEECKKMLPHKVIFGSHTSSHANLIKLDESALKDELQKSKLVIEEKLNVPCVHFACPWGKPGVNFSPETVIPIVKSLGYKSFATTVRGKMQKTDNLYLLKREHLVADWENFQIRYFFSK